jgi:hypothetical protein
MCWKFHYLLFFVLMLVVTGSLAAQSPGTENLRHLWTFEDGTANDQVGIAHGEFIGDNITVEDGDLVTIANGDGVADSWLELPGWAIDIADSYDEISVVAWFTPDTANNQWNTLWFFGNDGNGGGVGSNGFAFQPRRMDTKARTWISCGRETAPYEIEDGVDDVGNNYNNDTLYHVVCQLTQDEIIMYHDGGLIGSAPLLSDAVSGKDNAIYNISSNFARFAHSTYSGDLPWLGRIHEVAIFDRALNEEEVTYLFENPDWSASLAAIDKKEAGILPSEYGLAQNYPNPFNPTTEISYTVKQREQVKLIVFDILGREIATLVDGFQNPGTYNITFDAQSLTSGVYYYQLQTATGALTKKMVLMK